MKYFAVMFDLDGTLVNSLEDLADSANEALSKYGFKSHPTDAYKKFVGNGVKNLIKNAAPEGTEEQVLENILKDYRVIYNRNYVNKTLPYKNIPELLNALSGAGIKMAICSNKPDKPTNEIVEKLLDKGFFNSIFGEREGIPRKPDPAPLLEAAAEMGIKPENIIYLGDSGGDMIAAKKAGMLAAGVLWGFRDREELLENGADILLSDPLALMDYLKI